MVRPGLLLRIICLAYATAYAGLSLARYHSFHGQIDLSYYVRIVWGLAHGQYDVPLVQAPHLIGLHLEPILVPFAALARLGVPIAPLLLVSQAVAVACLPWPVYRLARRCLADDRLALQLAVASLLYPTVTVATLHDFHPVTLALPWLAAFLDAMEEGAWRRALGWGVLALGCREDIALQLALVLGAFAVVRPQVRRWLIAVALGLLLYFGLYIVVIQPQFLPTLGSYGLHFASGGAKVSSGRDLLLLLLRHPLRFAMEWLTWDRLRYVLELLWPLGLLPLLGPRLAIGVLPILGINFLSSFPRVRSIESHYTTAMVPFLMMAAVVGLSRLVVVFKSRSPRPMALGIGVALLGLTVTAHVLHGASPLAVWSSRYSAALFVSGPEEESVRAALAKVPPGASVSARPGPLAHLADRPRVISPPEYDDGQAVEVVLTPDAAPRGTVRIGSQPLSPH